MEKIYLFDWGNTLMVDFPEQKGKMRYWSNIASVAGATETLKYLHSKHKIYVATNAEDSTETDICAAFERAELAQFISGYFCKQNLGVSKSSSSFYTKIASILGVNPCMLTMVGDSLENDVKTAIEAGLDAIWFNQNKSQTYSGKKIRWLNELCT